MKRLFSNKLFHFFVISFLLVSSTSFIIGSGELLASPDQNQNLIASFPANDFSAHAAIVMDSDNNQVLWAKNSDEILYPASTTKIMTAILAIETVEDLDEVVTISQNASGRLWSKFAFQPGDKVSMRDLLKAALMISHNGATIAIAEHISGSEQEFAKLMNQKAKELGAENTNFQNSNGLDHNFPSHKSTAEDLALIGSYAVKNDLFYELVNTVSDSLQIINRDRTIELYNINALISYPNIKGLKTGYTRNAGHCVVTYSQKHGKNLVTVLMRSRSSAQRRADAVRLIDWASLHYNFQILTNMLD